MARTAGGLVSRHAINDPNFCMEISKRSVDEWMERRARIEHLSNSSSLTRLPHYAARNKPATTNTMAVDSQGYTAMAYAFAVAGAVAVAIYAFVKGYLLRSKITDTESFLTARGQVGWYRVAWSFYAGAVGAWVITSPAGYASFAGMLGLCMYAVAAGAPFLMIAYGGDIIRKRLPHVCSLTDFMGYRYGEITKATVCIIILFNMSIALLAEYYTIGTIFTYFVRSVPYAMVIVVGVLTLAYTAYGGLLVSIYTDTVQGIASVFFFLILALYMAITFRPGLSPSSGCEVIDNPTKNVTLDNGTVVPDTLEYCYSGLPCPPYGADGYAACVSGTPTCSQFDELGGNCPISGYSSILTMPLALFAATVFSEAMWQRCWASSDTRNLRIGAWVGAAITIVVVWFAGFTGLLTIWAVDPYLTVGDGLTNVNLPDGTVGNATQMANYDLYLFQVLYKGKYPNVTSGNDTTAFGKVVDDGYGGYTVYPSIQNWMGVILVVLAVIMNEGAVDSIQNGMAAAFASYLQPLIPQWNLWYTRGAVVVLNAGLVGIGAWLSLGNVAVSVIQLFLIANQLSICFFIPVLMGLEKRLQRYVGGGSFLFSGVFSVICLCIYGVNYFYTTFPEGWTDPFTGRVYKAGDFGDAMHYTWLGNGYAWDFFLVPACVSLGCMLLCIAIFAFFAHVKPAGDFMKNTLRLDPDMPIPGLASVANHPHLYEEGHVKRFGSSVRDDVLRSADLSESGKGSGDIEIVDKASNDS